MVRTANLSGPPPKARFTRPMDPWTTQSPTQSALYLLGSTIAGVGTVWLFTRSPSLRAAHRRLLDAPGILVPLAAATLLLYGVWSLWLAWPYENPLIGPPWWASQPPSHEQDFGLARVPSVLARWLILLPVAAALAGQIGLLESTADGDAPSGQRMLRGVRDHFVTMFVARALLAIAVFVIASRPGSTDELLLPLLLVPGVILAPVIGAASRSPGRPLSALYQGIAGGFRHLFRHGNLALRELLAMVFLAWCLRQLRAEPLDTGFGDDLDGLTYVAAIDLMHGGTLSFDHSFMAPFPWAGAALLDLPAVACGLFLQAVFVTAHWEACREPAAPASQPRA